MSATPRPPDRRATGFTLLELVVVLALLGLATALVAPQGFRMIDSWRRATDVDAALGAMAALGAQARQQGKAMEFAAGRLPAEQLDDFPADWDVVLDEPLHVQANGACSDTSGELVSGRYRRRFALQAPFCRAVLDPPASP